MKRSLIIFFSLGFSFSLLLSSYKIEAKKICVSDFGAIPNDGQNDAIPLRKAIAYCKANPGTTLYWAPGVYDLRDEQAVQLMNDAMSGKLGRNPQDKIFAPDFKYVKGLDFNGVHNVSIVATGATLLCDGWMEPVSLNNCKNVKITGLTIDYKRKPHSAGTIVDVQPDWFDAEFDKMYPMDTTMAFLRGAIWDVNAHRLLPKEYSFTKFTIIAPQKLRIYGKIDPSMTGNLVLSPHCFHFRPAILIHEAKDIKLTDVTIHAQPGMGIVGHRSENITMRGLHIVPSAGWVQSTNTDATHFTCCKGLIRYEDCQIEGQGDDGVNIHNYYYTIEKTGQDKRYDLIVKGADLHAQKLDYPDLGDTLELVKASSLEVVKKYVVINRTNNFAGMRTQVTLNGELPADLANYYLINSTRLPRVEITGCIFGNNRARGILIKTRNVLIERCLIKETTGTGIHVGAEGAWHEGPGSANVIIRNNRIIRCGSGAGSVGASGIAVNVGASDETVAGIHKNILIESNIIEGENADCGIAISGATDVAVRFNEIVGCHNPVKVKYSNNVNVYSNYGAADIIDKTIKE